MSQPDQKSNSVQFIEITAAQSGQRIDNFLLTLEKGVPRSRIYRAIRKGEVRVNKGRIKQIYRLQAGDSVRVPPLRTSNKETPSTLSDSLRQRLTAAILLEDDDLLVINKPAGLAVHAGSNIKQGVIEAFRILRADLPYLELVHRLDRDTSGCLLLAKNRSALLNLQQQLLAHDMDKRYLALLKGGWQNKDRLVDQPLKKNNLSSGERMVQVDADGKQAKTLFIARRRFPLAQLTEVVLYTGRTHQIRVHSAHMGHPIAGDDKYGQRDFNKIMRKIGLRRMFLHAWQLGISHPTNGKELLLEAPLPESLKMIIDRLEESI